MKLSILRYFGLTVFIAQVCLPLLSQTVHAAESIGKIVGQVGMIEGEVLVDDKPVQKNTPVREGSMVEVKKGKATLLLGTGSVFHLDANSKMEVKQFGMRADTNKEGGDVNLRFGRTRALVLNKGAQTKDVRIITRTATMGVRGTEIFIDAGPPGSTKAVQFFTLEGHTVVAGVPLAQNQGMSAGTGGKTTMASAKSVADVKKEIQAAGMNVASIKTAGDMKLKIDRQFLSDNITQGSIPSVAPLDPLSIRNTLSIRTHFCNATTANCL